MKKLIALLLAVVCILSVCAGCGGKSGNGGSNSGADDENVTLTIGLPVDANVLDLDNNALTKYLEEKTGYELKFQKYASGSEIATNITTTTLAGEKLPDILFGIDLGSASLRSFGENGYFMDLQDYFADRDGASKIFWDRLEENLEQWEIDEIVNDMTEIETGAIYAVPTLETSPIDIMDYQVWINQEWLDKVNLPMPTTPDELYNVLPDNWLVYQEFMLADSTTFLQYNANMRQLMVDKLQSCEVIVFNRYNDTIDKNELHKVVRGSSRKAAIGYEYEDGTFEQDTIEDPLPYDLNAETVVIRDEDYAVFYRDLSEEMDKYIGKTICFKGIVARDKSLPANEFVAGRHVMTCCEADITYRGLAVVAKEDAPLETRDWIIVTGKLELAYHKIYRGKGPVLRMISCDKAEKPQQEVATFF